MADTKISAFTAVTDIEATDLFTLVRQSAASDKNKSITGTNLKDQVLADVQDYTQVSIADTVIESIGLGAVATYQFFEVKAKIVKGTDRAGIYMRFVYDGTTAKSQPPDVFGTLDSGINIEQAVHSLGQFYWKITNNSGATITVDYRITEKA